MRLPTLIIALACGLAGITAPALAQVPEPTITIADAWTRATPPGAPAAGGYLTISNTGAAEDRLIGGSSPIADHVEIHDMGLANNVMTMRHLSDGLAIAPGATVSFSPSGYHFMLVGLTRPLVAGETLDVTLTFQKAGDIPVSFSVQPLGAREMIHAGH